MHSIDRQRAAANDADCGHGQERNNRIFGVLHVVHERHEKRQRVDGGRRGHFVVEDGPHSVSIESAESMEVPYGNVARCRSDEQNGAGEVHRC